MTTLEKIRAEIEEKQKNTIDWSRSVGLIDALEIIDKYAEQEPTYNMPCITPEEMQKCKDIVKKYTQKQEPCDDVVSRQAAKDLYCRMCMENNICYRSKDTCEDLKLFNQLPSVRPQEPKWIPVSERLPESAGVYIVTREFTDGFECADLADACYFDGTSTWHDDNRINHGREYVDKKIKAWMPLPEPYEPQESEE